MAVVLKQIMIGSVTNATATGTAPAGKVWMVKDIRLVNKHASTAATLNLTAGPSGTPRSVSPQNMSLGPGQMYQDDGEFILIRSPGSTASTGSITWATCFPAL